MRFENVPPTDSSAHQWMRPGVGMRTPALAHFDIGKRIWICPGGKMTNDRFRDRFRRASVRVRLGDSAGSGERRGGCPVPPRNHARGYFDVNGITSKLSPIEGALLWR